MSESKFEEAIKFLGLCLKEKWEGDLN